MIKGLVFDVDGVIIDSEKIWWGAFASFFKKDGVEVTDVHKKKGLGAGVIGAMKAIVDIEGLDYSIEDLKELEKKAIQIFNEKVKEYETLPGVVKLITQAKNLGIKLGIGTSLESAKLEKVIEGREFTLKDFESVITGEKVNKKKPDPEVYLNAAKGLGLNPSDCVAVEDVFNGVISAKTAGMRCIGVTNTVEREVLEEAKADWVVDSLEEIDLEKL